MVVPHAGTWIEIPGAGRQNPEKTVVPHAGTWIEIDWLWLLIRHTIVVPHAGTWIEIPWRYALLPAVRVVPHAGTWIEIFSIASNAAPISSFPTRERGLKYPFCLNSACVCCRRSPRGNVD